MAKRGQVARASRGSPGGRRTREYLVVPRKRSLSEVLAVNLLRIAARVVWWLSRHPVFTLTAAAFLASLHYLGRSGTGFVLMGLTVALAGWWWRWPFAFARLIGGPARGRWRWAWAYLWRWQAVMAMCELAKRYGDTEYLPAIRRVRSNKYVDRVLVRMLAGHSEADYEARTDALGHAFGARRCALRVHKPGQVWLDFFHGDALAETIAALPIPRKPNFNAVCLGRTEAGLAWVLRLPGSHVLIAGATGAGKASVLWSIVRGLANGIRQRSVVLWGIDPKGGMELTFGRAMFDRLAYENTPSMLDLLENAVAVMRERQNRYIGITRNFDGSVADPLIVLILDELAALIAYTVDAATKKRANALLQLLLSQGRAVGLVVIGALQDPGKDIIPFRDGFPTRIGLRLVEDEQVDMALGDGARKRGAECDRIPISMPGVGYVVQEGVREPVRVRAAYVSDRDLFDMSARYAPGLPDPDQDDTATAARHRSWLVRIFGRPAVQA